MPFSRYERCPILGFGQQFGTSRSHSVIRAAIKNGSLQYRQIVLHERVRLDHIAGQSYGNGRYWWIIAAASDIGWGLQVPPGTIINIPDLGEIAKLIG